MNSLRILFKRILIGIPVFLMCALMTVFYPVWRFTFWLNRDTPPGKGTVRELWSDWWDYFVVNP